MTINFKKKVEIFIRINIEILRIRTTKKFKIN